MEPFVFRLAHEGEIATVGEIYADILQGPSAPVIGWLPGVYPILETAQAAFDAGELYVCQLGDAVVAAARINHQQMDAYQHAHWQYPAQPQEVLVIHTLVVSPSQENQGIGQGFIHFYETMARQLGCPYLRIDTNEKNLPARRLYRKLGYQEVGNVPCTFCGIPNVQLICLEKALL